MVVQQLEGSQFSFQSVQVVGGGRFHVLLVSSHVNWSLQIAGRHMNVSVNGWLSLCVRPVMNW